MTHGPQPHSADTPMFLETGDDVRIAYRHTPGNSPGVIFCGGFASDMTGTKAVELETHVTARGHQFTRFDYQGHGQSTGRFEDGTIGTWKDDALAVLDQVTSGPQILIGSSMGGWVMTLLAMARPDRLAGLIGIAAAPDFTEDLMWGEFDEATRQTLREAGVHLEPSEYADEPTPITLRLIEDGRNHLVLRAPIPISVPVRLLHGMRDPDVPHRLAVTLAERIDSPDVQIMLIKDGDHRLSTDRDLGLLRRAVDDLLSD